MCPHTVVGAGTVQACTCCADIADNTPLCLFHGLPCMVSGLKGPTPLCPSSQPVQPSNGASEGAGAASSGIDEDTVRFIVVGLVSGNQKVRCSVHAAVHAIRTAVHAVQLCHHGVRHPVGESCGPQHPNTPVLPAVFFVSSRKREMRAADTTKHVRAASPTTPQHLTLFCFRP